MTTNLEAVEAILISPRNQYRDLFGTDLADALPAEIVDTAVAEAIEYGETYIDVPADSTWTHSRLGSLAGHTIRVYSLND